MRCPGNYNNESLQAEKLKMVLLTLHKKEVITQSSAAKNLFIYRSAKKTCKEKAQMKVFNCLHYFLCNDLIHTSMKWYALIDSTLMSVTT